METPKKAEKSNSWADQSEDNWVEEVQEACAAELREADRIRELLEEAKPIFEAQQQEKEQAVKEALEQTNFPNVEAARKTFFGKKEIGVADIAKFDDPKTASELVRGAAVPKPKQKSKGIQWVEIASKSKDKPLTHRPTPFFVPHDETEVIRRPCGEKKCTCYYVKRDPDTDKREYVNTEAIFIDNLPRGYNYDKMREALRKETESICGAPKSTYVFTKGEDEDRVTTGAAIITFKNHREACQAIELFRNTEFYGQVLDVNFLYNKSRETEEQEAQ
jgi:glutaredoxin